MIYREKGKIYLCTVSKPLEGIDEAVVIAGSDKRGTIYGIYEFSSNGYIFLGIIGRCTCR